MSAYRTAEARPVQLCEGWCKSIATRECRADDTVRFMCEPCSGHFWVEEGPDAQVTVLRHGENHDDT